MENHPQPFLGEKFPFCTFGDRHNAIFKIFSLRMRLRHKNKRGLLPVEKAVAPQLRRQRIEAGHTQRLPACGMADIQLWIVVQDGVRPDPDCRFLRPPLVHPDFQRIVGNPI